MLLTSSQVSAVVSSSIIVLFTVILFGAGLYLQHQSVNQLNKVLHPGGGRRGPWEQLVARAELALQQQQQQQQLETQEQQQLLLAGIGASAADGGLFISSSKNSDASTDGDATSLKAVISTENILQKALNAQHHSDPADLPSSSIFADDEEEGYDTTESSGGSDTILRSWKSRAYIHLVHTAEDVCAAVTRASSLSAQGSRARRILVHPSSWRSVATGAWAAGEDASEKALIEAARRQRLLEITDLDMVHMDHDANTRASIDMVENVGRMLLGKASDLDTLVFLAPDGIVLNATRLDRLFTIKSSAEIIALAAEKRDLAGPSLSAAAPVVLVRRPEDEVAAVVAPGAKTKGKGKAKSKIEGAKRGERSMLALRGLEVEDQGRFVPLYNSVETTRSLAGRTKGEVEGESNNVLAEADRVLRAVGYLMLSPVDGETAAAATGGEGAAASLLSKRSGGSTIPISQQQQGLPTQTVEGTKLGAELVDKLVRDFEEQKRSVCGVEEERKEGGTNKGEAALIAKRGLESGHSDQVSKDL